MKNAARNKQSFFAKIFRGWGKQAELTSSHSSTPRIGARSSVVAESSLAEAPLAETPSQCSRKGSFAVSNDIFSAVENVTHNIQFQSAELRLQYLSSGIQASKKKNKQKSKPKNGLNRTLSIPLALIPHSAAHMTSEDLSRFKEKIHEICESHEIADLFSEGQLVYRGGTLDGQLCHTYRQISGVEKEPKREGAVYHNFSDTLFWQSLTKGGKESANLITNELARMMGRGTSWLELSSLEQTAVLAALDKVIAKHVYDGGPRIIGSSTSKTFELALLFSLCRSQIKARMSEAHSAIMGQVGITIGMSNSYYPYARDVNYAHVVSTGGVDEEGMAKLVSLESSAYENETVMLSHHIFQHKFAVITAVNHSLDGTLNIDFKTLHFDEINIDFAFQESEDVAQQSAKIMKNIGDQALYEAAAWSTFQQALRDKKAHSEISELYSTYVSKLMAGHYAESALIQQAYEAAGRLKEKRGMDIRLPLHPAAYGKYKTDHWALLDQYEPTYDLSVASAREFSLRREKDCVKLKISTAEGLTLEQQYSVFDIRTMMTAFLAMHVVEVYGDNPSQSIKDNLDVDFVLSQPQAYNRLATYLIDKQARELGIKERLFPVRGIEHVTQNRTPAHH